MINTQAAIGGAFFVALASSIIKLVTPDPAFLTVHRLEVIGPNVVAERSVSPPGGVADWHVIVIPEKSASETVCKTRPNVAAGIGLSVYTPSEARVQTFHMDDWVGDTGCWDRMEPGKYEMWVYWNPRDENIEGTSAHIFFEKE